jgi:hypothetical protein
MVDGTVTPIFSSLMYDFGAILILGAVGGIVFALLMDKGLAWPGNVKTNGKLTMVNFGFIADIIVGAVAAAVVWALNPPGGITTLFIIGITSGIGGKAILTGYIQGKQKTELAQRYRAAIMRQSVTRGEQPDQSMVKELDEIDSVLL